MRAQNLLSETATVGRWEPFQSAYDGGWWLKKTRLFTNNYNNNSYDEKNYGTLCIFLSVVTHAGLQQSSAAIPYS